MKKNLSTTDVFFRFLLGVILIWLGDMLSPPSLVIAIIGIAATYLFLTGLFEYCPLFHARAFKTYSRKKLSLKIPRQKIITKKV